MITTEKILSAEEELKNKGYGLKDRGLTVTGVRKNKRETILSVASARNYEISWLQKALNTRLGIRKGNNGCKKSNSRHSV